MEPRQQRGALAWAEKSGGMLIIRPDFERRIDLPGVGPCPRPVDIDRSHTGFSNLVSLRVYSFAENMVIDGEAEADEVFIVLMLGQAEIAVSSDGREVGRFSLRRDGASRAVYMPPHASYRLTASTDCDIAYARVEPRETKFPKTRGFAPVADRLDIPGYAVGMELALATVQAGEDIRLGEDGRSLERFVHIRSDDEISATIAGKRLNDWDSGALNVRDSALLEVQAGTAHILTISASQRGTSKVAID